MKPVDRSHLRIRRLPLGPAADACDRAEWAAMTPDERVEAVWQVTVLQWSLMGWNPDEPGLCRSVARVVRR
jgi:hypothetical protein